MIEDQMLLHPEDGKSKNNFRQGGHAFVFKTSPFIFLILWTLDRYNITMADCISRTDRIGTPEVSSHITKPLLASYVLAFGTVVGSRALFSHTCCNCFYFRFGKATTRLIWNRTPIHLRSFSSSNCLFPPCRGIPLFLTMDRLAFLTIIGNTQTPIAYEYALKDDESEAQMEHHFLFVKDTGVKKQKQASEQICVPPSTLLDY
jgi:hypothetical protein